MRYNSIFSWGSIITINGGNYGRIYNFDSELTIDDGTIEEIYVNSNGDALISTQINKGTVKKLCPAVANDVIGTFIIGNENDEITTNSPVVMVESGSFYVFNNGKLISKDSSVFENRTIGDYNTFVTREGYTISVIYNSSTGLYECTLVPE